MSFVRKTFRSLFTKRYLLVTNTVSSGILMGLGDLGVQMIEKRTKTENGHLSIDWHRTGRLCVIGLGMGPLLHVWYKFLDRRFPVVSAISVARKVLLDQAIASPTLIVYFFIGTGFLEGRSFDHSFQELKRKFLAVYLVDAAVWPAAQTINFFLLPPRFRVIYVAMLALVYNMFLSVMKHMEDTADALVGFINKSISHILHNDVKPEE